MMYSAKIWRESPQRYRLEASKCLKCQKIFFPPRLICNECKGREFEKINLPWEGTLITYSVVHVPPSGFEEGVPYAIGIVEVEKNVHLTCQIVDIDPYQLQIGQKIHLEFRLLQRCKPQDVLCYGYKAVPFRPEIHP